jgi:3'(2'), 5'-bisphosphate nucleotidase
MTIDTLPDLPGGLRAKTILSLIESARNAILEVYHQSTVAVEYKADHSPLTLADRRSHAILSQGLSALSPLPILSEEGQQLDWEVRQQWQSFWLIDPLDGTRDFVDRTDEFTINLALVQHGRAVVGFLDVPVQQKTYLGILGHGAYRVQGDTVSPIFVTDRPPESGLRCAVSRAHSSKEEAWCEAQGIAIGKWIRAGSALKFALVAEGLADLYPRLGPTMEWDTAAGHCLVEAAGGSVCLIDTTPLRYNRHDLKNAAFIALSGAVTSLK